MNAEASMTVRSVTTSIVVGSTKPRGVRRSVPGIVPEHDRRGDVEAGGGALPLGGELALADEAHLDTPHRVASGLRRGDGRQGGEPAADEEPEGGAGVEGGHEFVARPGREHRA